MINQFCIFCASCVYNSNIKKSGKLECNFKVVDGIIPNGVVWFDTDATCIKDGVFKRIKE